MHHQAPWLVVDMRHADDDSEFGYKETALKSECANSVF
jgi:hypothetical protein